MIQIPPAGTPITRDQCVSWDDSDPLRAMRERFEIPPGVIYLDGNSLGPAPRGVAERIDEVIRHEWGARLIRSWNEAGWIEASQRVGRMLAPLIGAESDEVIVTDSISVNLFKLLIAGLRLQPHRTKIVADRDCFPTDLYIADSAAELLESVIVDAVETSEVIEAIDDETAIVFLSHVDYRTGERLDLPAITAEAQQRGALTLWDLAHSAGAMPIDLSAANVDFAVGCGYKYLNGGPGAPAFAYVHRRWHQTLRQPLTGWFGHQHPFRFERNYEAAAGIRRLQCGTPPILSLLALEFALQAWHDIDLQLVRDKSINLTELMIRLLADVEGLELRSPRDPSRRGSQVAFAHAEGYRVMQALIEAEVIGDFREPDLLRFGFAAPYVRYQDVFDAAAILIEILKDERWRAARFGQRATVT